MQLQILKTALPFCTHFAAVVIVIYSLWVRDWQLALVNLVAVLVGFRWLHRRRVARSRRAGEPASRSPPSLEVLLGQVPAALKRAAVWLTGWPSRSQGRSRSSARLSSTAARGFQDADNRRGNTAIGGGGTPAPPLAAAFRSSFGDARESQARHPQLDDAEGLKLRRPTVPATASAPATRRVAHAAPPPEARLVPPRKQQEAPPARVVPASAATSLAGPGAAYARPVSGPSAGPRKREPHPVFGANLSTVGEDALAEAEMAARRAEMELLQLLEAEASAKTSRSGRQREAAAVSTASAPVIVSAPVPPAASSAAPRKGIVVGQKIPTTAATAVVDNKAECQPMQAKELAKENSKVQPKAKEQTKEQAKEQVSKKAREQAKAATLQKEMEKAAANQRKKEKEVEKRRRQLAKIAATAVSDRGKDGNVETASLRKEEKLAAMLNAVAESTALNAKRTHSISSVATHSGSSSPSPTTSPASIAEIDADRRSPAASRSTTSGRGIASGHGDSDSAELCSESAHEPGDGWSMQSSADTREAADSEECGESIDGDVAAWARSIEAAHDGSSGLDYSSVAHISAEIATGEMMHCHGNFLLEMTQGSHSGHWQASQYDPPLPTAGSYAQEMPHYDPLLPTANPCAHDAARLPPTPPPPPPPAPDPSTGNLNMLLPPPLPASAPHADGEGIGLAQELRAIFPSASIHIGPPPTPKASPRGQVAPPPVADLPAYMDSQTSQQHPFAYAEGLAQGLPAYPKQLDLASLTGGIIGPYPGQVNAGGIPGPLPPCLQVSGLDTTSLPTPLRQRIGEETAQPIPEVVQSMRPEVLFKLPAASLGPPPSGAPSVAQVEATSKASSWRDRLRRHGDQHLGEVEATLRRRQSHSSDLPTQPSAPPPQPSGLPAPPVPLYESMGMAPQDIQMPPSGSQLWPGDTGPIYGAGSLECPPEVPLQAPIQPFESPGMLDMQVQLPPSGGPLWSGGSLPPCPVESEGSRLPWEMPPADGALWHAESSILGAGHAYPPEPAAYMEAMPMDREQSLLDREQIAAQLRAAAPCHYED